MSLPLENEKERPPLTLAESELVFSLFVFVRCARSSFLVVFLDVDQGQSSTINRRCTR